MLTLASRPLRRGRTPSLAQRCVKYLTLRSPGPQGPLTLRTGAAPCGKTLLGHHPLAGLLRCGMADKREDDSDDDPDRGDDRVPCQLTSRVGINIAEVRVADDDQRQKRHDHFPRRDLPLAREEQQLRGPMVANAYTRSRIRVPIVPDA